MTVAADEAPSLEAALAAGLDRLQPYLRWGGATLFLPNEIAPAEFAPTVAWQAGGSRAGIPLETRVAPGEGLIGEVLLTGRAAAVEGAAGAHELARLGIAAPATALFIVPITCRGLTTGALAFYGDEPGPLPPGLRRLLEHVGSQLGRQVERRKAEAALRLSESRYRLLAENCRDVITLAAADGTLLYVSPACRHVLGREPEELVGTSIWAWAHEADLDAARAAVQATPAEGVDPTLVIRVRRRNGRWAWVEASVRLFRDPHTGEVAAALAISRDITDRVAAEETLRFGEAVLERTTARFQAIFGNAADAIVVCDDGGRIALWNEAAVRLFGYGAHEVIGLPLEKLVAPALAGALRERQARLVAEVGVVVPALEVDGVHRDGHLLAVEVSSSSWRAGDELCTSHTFRDVTERRRLAESKDEFVAIISHELRTPLNTTALALDVLVSDATVDLPPQQRRLLEIAHGNLARLGRLVNDILEFKRLGLGEITLAFRDADAAELVGAAVELTMPTWRRRHLTVRQAVPPMRIRTDPDRLVQVLVNLIGNAAKFTRQGGTFGVVGSQEGDHVLFEVWDEGPGIAPEHHDHIFAPFQQVAMAPHGELHQGTGLGLAIARRLVTQLGGEIWVESELGRGARFFVRLPTGS